MWIELPWRWSSGLIPPVLYKDKEQLREQGRARQGERGKRERKRVVFADLILTSPGRVFPWNRFAIALLFIQVVGESSEICREHAFCNTSLWILNTSSMSIHTAHTQTSTSPTLQRVVHVSFKLWHLQGMRHFVGSGQIIPLCLNFKVKFLHTTQELSNATVPSYWLPTASLLERMPPVALCVWLLGRLRQQHPLGQSSALWKATTPQRWLPGPLFMQQYTTARLKGKRAKQWREMKGSYLQK